MKPKPTKAQRQEGEYVEALDRLIALDAEVGGWNFRSGTKAEAKRRKLLLARFADGYTEAEIETALRNAYNDSWLRGTGRLGLDYWARDTKFEAYLNKGTPAPAGHAVPSPDKGEREWDRKQREQREREDRAAAGVQHAPEVVIEPTDEERQRGAALLRSMLDNKEASNGG